jgi:hypothetical protein
MVVLQFTDQVDLKNLDLWEQGYNYIEGESFI